MRLILALVLAITATAQPLEESLRARIGSFGGKVSLCAKNLDSGTHVGIHESDAVPTASTIKLPIMLAVFDAVARGQAKWTELLAVNSTARIAGSGVIASEISDSFRSATRCT
jgi:beta-lactamase class A